MRRNLFIHTLKSNPNLNNLIVNQCARTLSYRIPCMSIKAAINMHLLIYLFYSERKEPHGQVTTYIHKAN
jgi:hypothetical protein